MKISHALVAAAAGFSLILTGCATEDNSAENNSASSQQNNADRAYTLEAENGTIELESEPKRIVVLDYASLDTLAALGEKDRVVSTAKAATMPKAAEGIEANAGSLKEPDMEAIAAADPDLILIGGRQAKMLKEFEKIAPTANMTINYDHYTIDSNMERVEALGKLFGKEAEAKEKSDEIRDRVKKIADSVPADKKEAAVLMTSGGEISLYGADSRFGLVFNDLGFTPAGNIDSDSSHGENASFELLKKINPKTIFVIDRDAAIGQEGHSAKATLDNELVKQTDAAKEDRIYMLSGADWYLNGGGIDGLNTMLDDIEQAL